MIEPFFSYRNCFFGVLPKKEGGVYQFRLSKAGAKASKGSIHRTSDARSHTEERGYSIKYHLKTAELKAAEKMNGH